MFLAVSIFVGQGMLTGAVARTGTPAPSAELRALAGARSGVVMNVIDGLAWLAIIYVMVAKPFT